MDHAAGVRVCRSENIDNDYPVNMSEESLYKRKKSIGPTGQIGPILLTLFAKLDLFLGCRGLRVVTLTAARIALADACRLTP